MMAASDTTTTITLRRLYLLTGAFTIAGMIWQGIAAGPKSAIAFLLGGVGSALNLWVFNWLTQIIAPRESVEPTPDSERKNPWGAGLFIGRFAGLWLVGYATVKALDVSPLPVLLGLLASTAAVLASSIFELGAELFRSLLKK